MRATPSHREEKARQLVSRILTHVKNRPNDQAELPEEKFLNYQLLYTKSVSGLSPELKRKQN